MFPQIDSWNQQNHYKHPTTQKLKFQIQHVINLEFITFVLTTEKMGRLKLSNVTQTHQKTKLQGKGCPKAEERVVSREMWQGVPRRDRSLEPFSSSNE